MNCRACALLDYGHLVLVRYTTNDYPPLGFVEHLAKGHRKQSGSPAKVNLEAGYGGLRKLLESYHDGGHYRLCSALFTHYSHLISFPIVVRVPPKL